MPNLQAGGVGHVCPTYGLGDCLGAS